MSVGDVAGLIAAIGFVLLVGLLALPIIKLGRVFDEMRRSIRDVTEHSTPILDEAVNTVAGANAQLEKVDVITTSAAQTAENASALAGLYAAALGRPVVKVASFTYAARQAFAGAWEKTKATKSAKKTAD
ncbi:MAG: DUF948 domain-containing protein [Promicromonosporaceae bacterium]|nr:DUF948 domain-containing protein [Promicromonosporaceae bacterium]